MPSFSENPWFKSLSTEDADALLAVSKPITLTAGEFLYHQHDSMDASTGVFFGLIEGLLKSSIFNTSGDEAILNFIEPGNWLGGPASLDKLPRPVNIIALTDSNLLAVDMADFDALMQRLGFAQAIARLLASRLRLAGWLIMDSALQTVQARLCRRLIILAHGDVTQSQDGRSSLTTSQDSLAMMLGVSRPTLNKELQILAKMGAISLRYGRIEIEDMQLLLKNIDQ